MNLARAFLLSGLCLPSLAATEAPVKAKVPGQAVEISLEIPGFVAKDDPGNADRTIVFGALGEDAPDPRSTLIFGALGRGVWIWVSWRENFPAVSGEALAKRYASVKGWTGFSVENTACFELRMQDRGLVLQTLFGAWLESPEYTFAVRVVVENLTAEDLLSGKKSAEKLSRDAFSKLVRSFQTTGKPDRAAMRFPPDAYAFRDEVVKSGQEAAGWTRKQCTARPDEWAPELYLGMIARVDDRPDLAAPGFARALELLEARKDRDAQLDSALACAARGGAWVQVRKKSYSAAVPLLQRVLELANEDSAEAPGAAFDLACSYAQTQQAAKAIESLKRALALRPEWRSRAAGEDLLKPLRKSKEFEALVGK